MHFYRKPKLMSDEQAIFLDPDDDLNRVTERLAATTERRVVIIVPQQTEMRSNVFWRLLYSRARDMKKEVTVISADKQMRSIAKVAGFHVADAQASSPPGEDRSSNPGRYARSSIKYRSPENRESRETPPNDAIDIPSFLKRSVSGRESREWVPTVSGSIGSIVRLCTYCGKPLPRDDARFCNNCGSVLSDERQNHPGRETQSTMFEQSTLPSHQTEQLGSQESLRWMNELISNHLDTPSTLQHELLTKSWKKEEIPSIADLDQVGYKQKALDENIAPKEEVNKVEEVSSPSHLGTINMPESASKAYPSSSHVDKGPNQLNREDDTSPAATTSTSIAEQDTHTGIQAPKAIKLFYCYAREDIALRNELEKHLGLLKRQGKITNWHDRDISAGQEWTKEIDINLNTADIILLLISPDFLDSDYCYSVEMKRALERYRNKEARVIPVILRPVDWEDAPFSELQVLPTDGKPVYSALWHNRDEAFWDIAKGIRKVVKEILDSWG